MLNRDLIDRLKLPFRKEKELFLALRDILGFYPRRIEYYKLALMHKSVARRNEKGRPLNNERLEFLGDAILDAVVGDIVYRHFEGKREGFLTNTRSKLVQRDTLNRLAHEMGIDQLIRSSQNIATAHNSYMGGNAFEALVGAIYLDRGYSACMRFMQKRILSQLINIDKMAYKEVNFKSKLLEWTQKNRVQMAFNALFEGKDDKGSPFFEYQVMLEGVAAGKGKGYSKKESQQLAAKETLQRLRREPQLIDSVFAAKADRTKMEEMPTHGLPADIVAADGPGQMANDEPVKAEGEHESPRNAAGGGRSKADGGRAEAENGRAEAVRSASATAEEARLAADSDRVESENRRSEQAARPSERRKSKERAAQKAEEKDEFDLSDITACPAEPTREEIIAMAEAQAYAAEND